jgi:hypothetical protein
MTRTVLCPECHRPARLVDSFTVQRSTGPVEFFRVQCEGTLSFLISVEEMGGESRQPATEPGDPVGGVA